MDIEDKMPYDSKMECAVTSYYNVCAIFYMTSCLTSCKAIVNNLIMMLVARTKLLIILILENMNHGFVYEYHRG